MSPLQQLVSWSSSTLCSKSLCTLWLISVSICGFETFGLAWLCITDDESCLPVFIMLTLVDVCIMPHVCFVGNPQGPPSQQPAGTVKGAGPDVPSNPYGKVQPVQQGGGSVC